MTAASVGAHGSAGAPDPLGAGLAGAESDGFADGGELGDWLGVASSGSAARAVSDG